MLVFALLPLPMLGGYLCRRHQSFVARSSVPADLNFARIFPRPLVVPQAVGCSGRWARAGRLPGG